MEYEKSFKTEVGTILEEYKYYLKKKAHKSEYIQEHLEFLRFFSTNYLIGNIGQTLLEIDEDEIFDFLGNWYIRKVLDFTKADIIPLLRIFKKFSSFLYNKKKISEEQYLSLKEAYNNPRYFVQKFEGYKNLNPDSENWSVNFESWLYDNGQKSEAVLKQNLNSILKSDEELIETKLKDISSNVFSIVKDFKTFAKYISNFKKGIKLTNNLFCLRREDLLELNSLMNNSEALDQNIFQKDTVLLHFFFIVSKELGFCNYTKKMRFKTTPLYKFFLNLPLKYQYWILLRGLWDVINWYRLNGFSDSGRPMWFFNERYIYSTFFSTIPQKGWMNYREFVHLYDAFAIQSLNINNSYASNRLYYGIFVEKILPLFAYFGLFKVKHNNNLNKLELSNEIKLKITPLGRRIFSKLRPLNNDEVFFPKIS
ncbi:MAG: hypothetical protein GF317_00955 [Candidatus Lokiarchaeota archaeon]|nr:hypothetical protein [Candidatus Lokiarchaeota archaeon]MBD3198527.1 hypothetical protein [Candidatus Lokiarchaeota archaeon]